MNYRKLLAVDPSLTCSGWALFHIEQEKLIAVGKVKSLPASHELSIRLEDIQKKIVTIFHDVGIEANDIVVCEAQTTMKDPRAAFLVEQVRGIFETIAREKGALVPGRINPRSVQNEIMGLKGKQLKREIVKSTAVHVVENLYKNSLSRIGFNAETSMLTRNQDIVDAILVGRYGITKVHQSKNTGVPLEALFSQNKRRTNHSRWQ